MATDERPPSSEPDDAVGTSESLGGRILQAEELFGADTELVIVHDGMRYRLRITKRGKLILQK